MITHINDDKGLKGYVHPRETSRTVLHGDSSCTQAPTRTTKHPAGQVHHPCPQDIPGLQQPLQEWGQTPGGAANRAPLSEQLAFPRMRHRILPHEENQLGAGPTCTQELGGLSGAG